ncbi:MAG: Nif11-like leader peptide family RiPP precursor [Oscillospiraceae bacterium]|nr:Nif11-like leader peptide family RiPP precursor [Oscillospiraceae bacterium]
MENKENKLTPELIKKARQAKSPEELLALAKENGITLSEDEAKEYFERLNGSGEISDEELDNVAGGGCLSFPKRCPKCGKGTIVYNMYHPYIGGYHNFCNNCKTVYD